MTDDLRFDISGIPLRLRGVPAGCAEQFRARWQEFAPAGASDAVLDARVLVEGPPADGREISGAAVRSRFDAQTAHFAIEEGSAEVARDGRASIRLRPASARMQFFGLLNLLMPALAWLLPPRGKLMLHGAGLVLGGHGLVLIGPAGSGKSTWVGSALERGAVPLSDDIILLDVRPGRPSALGAPFRTSDFGSSGPGRWPLAALLLPLHGRPPALAPVAPMLARARLAANLPYIAPTIEHDGRASDLIEALIAEVPVRSLTFAPDASFFPLLEELVRSAGSG